MVESTHHGRNIFLRCALAAALLAGCAREDEELHRQVVELRAEVQAKSHELEELRAKATSTTSQQSASSSSSNADLTKAKARIGELESEVAKLNAKLSEAKSQPEAPASISMKFDVDAIKDKLESDLTRKASELRDLVLRQSGISSISEISIKRLELPPEVVAPFHSAITFTLMDNGKPLRVQFPVTADFGGSWRLPSPDKIQQACQQAREQMAAGTPPVPPPASGAAGAAPPSAAPAPRTMTSQSAPASHVPSMKRVDSNTFVMDWGDKSSAPPSGSFSPASAPSSAPAAAPPGAGLRTPSGQGAAPAPTNVPPPVMPVQRDIIIKF